MIDQVEQEANMLHRHLQVLEMVIENEPIGIVKMSNETGHRHHKIRYSLRVLEEKSLIEPTKQGAITTDQTSAFVDDFDERIDTVSEQVTGMKPNKTVEGTY